MKPLLGLLIERVLPLHSQCQQRKIESVRGGKGKLFWIIATFVNWFLNRVSHLTLRRASIRCRGDMVPELNSMHTRARKYDYDKPAVVQSLNIVYC